ncbi:MAG: 30S ribosomal protein S12 methylthiotransferase RimO, partial [Actinobacteria bacterium]|nr:30S ribosomal protein S12 methylthiotransferase RimO [Actinomycetota bacterium]
MKRTVAVVTMGCARNEVDSEELAGRLAADGWTLVDDVELAEVALVNTCGFIESAKKDSIDALLEANSLKGHGVTRAVVAVGCMAERYGQELAKALPEADAILGFDDYKDISARLQSIMAGNSHTPHVPRDRRSLLPIAPVDRAAVRDEEFQSALGAGGSLLRKRLGNAPWAPLKIASGCDRRCSFCAIPYFRGAFVSRRPTEILDEARWLSTNGVSELFLVSENTTSYGKDLGDLTLMEKLLPDFAEIPGVELIRLSYLQPAEMRPSLLQAMISTPKVAPYFDLSFQHTSATVLRRMRRFGDSEKFLHLIAQIRALSPEAGIRSNFIVGFPGETQEDFDDLANFITQAKLDAVGIFGYSDEDDTEALKMEDKVAPEVIAQRVETLSSLADEMVSLRAQARIGETVRVLIE